MNHYKSLDHERLDELHTLLADRYRRETLRYFRDASSDVASVDDIAANICDQRERETVRTQLHHNALPRLDAADVVEYDSRSKTARYHGHPDLETLIESLAYL